MNVNFQNRTKKLFSVQSIVVNGKQTGSVEDQVEQSTYCSSHLSDFTTDNDGWIKNYSDYPFGDEVSYEIDYSNVLEYLPFPLDGTKSSIHQLFNNINSKTFSFIYKKITLAPNSTFDLKLQIEAATNISDTITTAQQALGNYNTVKAGFVISEPSTFNTGVEYQTNFNKGNTPNLSGSDLFILGQLTNKLNTNQYSLVTLTDNTKHRVTTDNSGEIWMVVGVHSSCNIPIDIYFNKISLIIYCIKDGPPPPPSLIALGGVYTAGSGAFGEDAFSQITLFVPDQLSTESDYLYFYNTSYDPNSTQYTSMLVYVNGTPRALVTYTIDRENTDFWYSITGNSPQVKGVFTSGSINLTI